MTYECNCSDISLAEWKKKMKGIKPIKPINYKWLIRKIKKHLPHLYESLMIDVYNPYQEKCVVNRDYYVLVHSAIEYFIKKK